MIFAAIDLSEFSVVWGPKKIAEKRPAAHSMRRIDSMHHSGP
jgi:hypothetical protein